MHEHSYTMRHQDTYHTFGAYPGHYIRLQGSFIKPCPPHQVSRRPAGRHSHITTSNPPHSHAAGILSGRASSTPYLPVSLSPSFSSSMTFTRWHYCICFPVTAMLTLEASTPASSRRRKAAQSRKLRSFSRRLLNSRNQRASSSARLTRKHKNRS